MHEAIYSTVNDSEDMVYSWSCVKLQNSLCTVKKEDSFDRRIAVRNVKEYVSF